ncbi:MAG: hypothetical protein HY423_13650, partial [Candidatus Lambdaproteobacteria bacterium]|nr:hypothetical protein [Candidatus Lambdaproteobacteria bacterium]
GAGHAAMTIGIAQFREPKYLRLDWLLIQPWLGDTASYPLGARQAAPGRPAADDRPA